VIGFGGRLKEERKKLGLTQSRMAEAAAVTSNTQLNCEKGVRRPDAACLAAVATAGVDVLYVLTGARTPHREESLSPDESEVLSNFRALSQEDKQAVYRLTHALAGSRTIRGSENVS